MKILKQTQNIEWYYIIIKNVKLKINKTNYIGEVGLDFSNKYIKYKDRQIEIFNYICNIASKENKIMIIHSRKAEKEVLNILIKNNIRNAIMHWYTGPINSIDDFVKNGYYFSINPSMLTSIS